MTITARCSCGWTKTLTEFYAGKMVRCPVCATVVEVARPKTVYSVGDLSESASAAVPYGYPPYASWKRPQVQTRRAPGVVLPAYRHQPATSVEFTRDAVALFSSAVLVLIWGFVLAWVWTGLHPLAATGLAFASGAMLISGAPRRSSRRSTGAFMLLVASLMLFGALAVPSRMSCMHFQMPTASPRAAEQPAKPKPWEIRSLPSPEELRRDSDRLYRMKTDEMKRDAEKFMRKSRVDEHIEWVNDFIRRHAMREAANPRVSPADRQTFAPPRARELDDDTAEVEEQY